MPMSIANFAAGSGPAPTRPRGSSSPTRHGNHCPTRTRADLARAMPLRDAVNGRLRANRFFGSPLPCESLAGHVALELVEPYPGVAVGWRAPVAAWREVAARYHFGPVGERRAFVLADLEEAEQKYPEPLLDFSQRVRAAQFVRKCGRPRAACRVLPCVPREERNFRRAQSVARDVVKVEVLQLVWANLRLRA